MKKTIATILPLSLCLLASTTQATTQAQSIRNNIQMAVEKFKALHHVKLESSGKTLNLRSLCTSRNERIKKYIPSEDQGQATRLIDQLNSFNKAEKNLITKNNDVLTDKQYAQFNVCMSGLITLRKNTSQKDHITKLVADYELYSQCKKVDMPTNLAAMAAEVATNKTITHLQANLPPAMQKANDDPNIINNTLCDAVDRGLIAGKDLEIPQFKLVVTPK